MNVKICGITRLQDAIDAISLGADMLGFNFFPGSKRYVTPEACTEMLLALRDGDKTAVSVGIFVNASPAEVVHIMESCGLDLAQLCGDEPPADLQVLKGKAFKAIRPRSLPAAAEQVQQYALFPHQPALLMDAYHPGSYGGSGQTGDWSIAAHFARDYPLLLAGGLTPANVATAVSRVQPWGVDVASGVEESPGIKSIDKMRAFITGAKVAGNK